MDSRRAARQERNISDEAGGDRVAPNPERNVSRTALCFLRSGTAGRQL